MFLGGNTMSAQVFGVMSNPTTLEEYNYLTKGYKVQVESGLDMKRGYQIKFLDKRSAADRSAELFVLKRELLDSTVGVRLETAGYLVVYQKSGSPKEYICIPNPNAPSEILSLYWKQLWDGSTMASGRLQLILFLVSGWLDWSASSN